MIVTIGPSAIGWWFYRLARRERLLHGQIPLSELTPEASEPFGPMPIHGAFAYWTTEASRIDKDRWKSNLPRQ